GAAVLNLLPLPNQRGATQIGQYNWAETAVYTVQQKQWSVRLDEYLSANQRLFGRISRLERDVFEHEFFPGDYNWPVNGGLTTVKLRPMTSAAPAATFTPPPTFIGSARYGFSRRFDTIQIGGYGLDPATLHLPAAIINNQAARGYPIFNLGEGMPTIGSSLN